jgi:hypothetical protein
MAGNPSTPTLIEYPSVKAITCCCLTALMALVTGCGNGPKLGRVSGTVTVDGKLVTRGRIMFIPTDGKAAVGEIGPDGKFTLTTYESGDGALIGPHKVTILATTIGPSSFAPASIDEEVVLANSNTSGRILVPGKVGWIVPERYSQLSTTGLTAEVKSGERINDFKVSGK